MRALVMEKCKEYTCYYNCALSCRTMKPSCKIGTNGIRIINDRIILKEILAIYGGRK